MTSLSSFMKGFVTLLLLLVGFAAQAETVTVGFDPLNSAPSVVGDQVVVNLVGSYLADNGLQGGSVSLTFDSSVVNLVSVDFDSATWNFLTRTDPDVTDASYDGGSLAEIGFSLLDFTGTGVRGDFIIATLTFVVVGTGSTDLTLGSETSSIEPELIFSNTDSEVVTADFSAVGSIDVSVAQVTVPDVVDKTQANAEATLVGASLTVGTVTTANSDTVTAGNVISQDPVAGTSVETSSAVNLVVSLGVAQVTYELTVEKTGNGSGSIAGNLGIIDCGITCTANYEQNSTVTLTAVADADSLFIGWSGGVCSGTAACIVTMNAAEIVTAKFILADELISVWNKTAIPTNPFEFDPNAVELGVKFISEVDGYVIGILFYRGSGNDGPHIGNLWSSNGQLLATAVFSDATEFGWQQVEFDDPVHITEGEVYVASYFAPHGNYAADDNFFTDKGVTNGPLQLLQEGVSGGNGVYVYGPNSDFPNKTYKATNYWVDVLFYADFDLDTTVPLVKSVSPVENAFDVIPGTAVKVVFNEAMDRLTIEAPSDNFLLLDGSNTTVPATVTYDVDSKTATLIPDQSLNYDETYTVLVIGGTSGASDLNGNTLESDFSSIFTIAAPVLCPCSLWDDTVKPSQLTDNDTNAVELGVKLRSDVDGYITGIRFYKGIGNTGTHEGNLWTSGGTLLANATFTNESGSGWQQVNFPPVAITNNTVYVASYHAPNGHYANDNNFFVTAGLDNPPLHFLQDGVNGGNGVYVYGDGGIFPASNYLATYYWVDVVFTTTNN